jgi:alpha-beta hydrolase superfamily lysophospholipase
MKRTLIALGILVFLFIFFVVPYFFSWVLTHAGSRPSDREMTVTPEEFGLVFQPVTFAAQDGATLAGWWLPAEESPVAIIYCHGLFRSRLEMLERAAHFRQKGYAGLLFDFRRHGESKGELSSAGFLERLDVLAAVKFLRDSLRVAKPIVTYAVSMGTGATMLAAAESPEIAGLILDSSFLSFDHLIAHHAKIWLGLPKFPLVDEIILFTKWRAGFRSEQFDMKIALDKIGDRPLLFIAGGKDVRMPPEISQELFAHSKSTRKRMVVFEEATHGAAFTLDPARYEKKLIDFLTEHFSAARTTSQPAPSSR